MISLYLLCLLFSEIHLPFVKLLYHFRSFCTATRNYAKRQLNWYRKDSMFLFIGMHRRHVAKEVAYLRAAEEVWHWATCPRAEFTDAVKAQVEANNALSELRARKLVPREYLPDTPAKRLALAYLLHTGEYKLPKIVQLQQKLALSNPSDSEDASVSLENVHDSAVDTNESDAETETMSNRERKKLARKERKYVVAVNLNAPRTAGSAGDRPLDIDIETKAGSTAEPVIPAWVGIIQDEALGITPEAMALYNPEWSAQGNESTSYFISGHQNSTLFIFYLLCLMFTSNI